MLDFAINFLNAFISVCASSAVRVNTGNLVLLKFTGAGVNNSLVPLSTGSINPSSLGCFTVKYLL